MSSVAIIVPYRNRKSHLVSFQSHMFTYLSGIDYHIHVIEQCDEKPFNRGKLLNIGFVLSKDTSEYVVFHDVDMLPIEADYSRSRAATHIATRCSQFNYAMPYPTYFGGVTIFEKAAFEKINGYSNDYWGWGAEDDDLMSRCVSHGISIDRRQCEFLSLHHSRVVKKEEYDANVSLLHRKEKTDSGLSNLEYCLKEKIPSGLNTTFYKVVL